MTTIACKHLASLNQPDACERCFLLRCRLSKLPYAIFPSIFSSIDSYSKRLIDAAHLAGVLPGWLGAECGFVEPLRVPHFSRFQRYDPETGITLRGAPDAIFRRVDGSFAVSDWKCAKYTAGQERLAGMYEGQLNGYAWLGRNLGYAPVTHLSLIYTEPVTEFLVDDLNRLINVEGFSLPFAATIVLIENRADELIPQLLRRARRIIDGPFPPPAVSCKDCVAAERLVALLGEARCPA